MFSKYVHAKAGVTQQAHTLIDFMREVFSSKGVPSVVQTDQGSNLLSEEFETFLVEKGIQHRYSSPYHPQTNGQVERTNQTLGLAIKKLCGENPADWDKKLKEIVFSINNTVNVSTGKSLHQIVYKYQPRTPVHNTIGQGVPIVEYESIDHSEEFKQIHDRLERNKDTTLERRKRVYG